MIIKTDKLQSLMDRRHWSRKDFADTIGVQVTEVNKMLAGEPVGYDTSRKFIHYFKGNRAQHLIDWDSLGVDNPLTRVRYDEDDDDESTPNDLLPPRDRSPVFYKGKYVGRLVMDKEGDAA